jgi:TP901 family phage tail tape measure protein
VSFGGDSASFDILVNSSGLEELGSKLGSSVAKGVNTAEKSVKGLDQTVAHVAKSISASSTQLGKAIGANVAKGIKSNSASVQAALIQAATQGVRGSQQAAAAAARSNLAAQNAAARLQVAQTTAAGKQQAAIAQSVGQQAVIAARTSGAQRVAITRAFLDTIGRLEKGLGRVIEGTASTIVSATRRVFAGTVGSIQRSFAQRHEVITKNLRIEQGLFASAAAVQQRSSRGVLGLGLGAAGLIGGGALLATGIRQIFTLGSDFTRGLNVLQAQLQLTDAQMKGVDALSIKLGNDINLPGVSALDAAQAIGLLAKQFASLGPAAITAAQDAAKGTLQLARAVGAAPEEAAQTVGAAVNVFGENAANATKVADQLTAALSQAAGTSFSDFSQAFTQGASVVSSFITPADGASNAITEFSAALAVLARGGLVGSDAGTSIKQFFLQANRGTKEVAGALAEISARAGETGTAFFTASGQSRSLVETISILERGLKGLTAEQRASTLQTIFGSDATRVANILIDQGAAALLTAEAAVQRQGAASALAAAQNKGLAGAIDAIKSQFETFGIQIFKVVQPALATAGLALAGFIDKLANAGGIFAAVRAGLKGIGVALGALVAIKGLVEVVGFARALVGALGPLGIAAIVLGGAIGFLLKRFGSFQGVLDAVGRLVERVAPAVARLRKTIFDFLSGLAQRASFLGRFRGFLSQIFDLLGQGKLSQAFDRVKVAAKALAENLAPVGRAFANLRKPIEAFIQGDFVRAFEGLKVVAGQIGTAIRNVVSAALKTVDPFAGIGIEFVKKFKAQFIGGGIGAIAGGLLLGPIGIPLGAALGVAVTNALGKLKDIVGRVDVGALFGKFLDGVQLVGRKIGEILSDKRTILAVAGVAAAAAAIAVQFVQGFVKGVLSNLGDIRAAGAEILKALFNLPSVAKSILALVVLIRGTLTGQFKSAGIGKAVGAVLGKEIADGTAQAVDKGTLGSRLKGAFVSIGKGAGQALSIGISAALSGSALGSAKSGLDQTLGLASLAGSVAAAGAVFGPVGAVGAAGIGLVTTAMSQNAQAAQDARDRMLLFRDAMIQTGAAGPGVAKAIDAVFGPGGSFPSALKGTLAGTSFTTEAFTKAINAGRGNAFIKDIQKQVLELTGSIPTATAVAGLLTQQLKAAGGAAKDIKLSKELTDSGGALATVNQRAGRLVVTAKDVAKFAAEAAAKTRELFKEQRAERLQGIMDALSAKAKDIGDKADASRTKLLALFGTGQAKTPDQATNQAVVATPGAASDVQGAIDTGVTTALGKAQLATALQGFSANVGEALVTGITSADPLGAISQTLLSETLAINALEVSPEAKQALLAQLNADFATAKEKIPVGVEIAQQEAAAAGLEAQRQAAAAAAAAGKIPISSGADLVQAQQAGREAALKAGTVADGIPANIRSKADTGSATGAGNTIHSTAQKAADKPITVGSTVNVSTFAGTKAGGAIASAVMAGFKSGVSASSASVSKTVTTVLNGAVINTAQATLRISSPSKVFMEIGEQTMKGLEQGIRDGGAAVKSAVEDVARAMIDALNTPGNSVPGALKTLFDDTFERLAIGGGANTSKAVEGLTTALRSVITQVRSNAETLFAAGSKPEGERTLAERLLLGESFTSLRAGDEFGVANRGAIAGAVDAIKSIGEALLEQGFSAQDAANQLAAYRNQLVATAVQAGLSQAEVEALVVSLGLSNAGLAAFVGNANRLNQIVAEGQRRAAVPNTPPPLTTGPNPTQQFITNNLYLPTGDPEANALAVVNRQALAVR